MNFHDLLDDQTRSIDEKKSFLYDNKHKINLKDINEISSFFNNNPKGMMDNVSDEMVTSYSIVGSQTEVSDKLQEYKKYLDLPIPTNSQLDSSL